MLIKVALLSSFILKLRFDKSTNTIKNLILTYCNIFNKIDLYNTSFEFIFIQRIWRIATLSNPKFNLLWKKYLSFIFNYFITSCKDKRSINRLIWMKYNNLNFGFSYNLRIGSIKENVTPVNSFELSSS